MANKRTPINPTAKYQKLIARLPVEKRFSNFYELAEKMYSEEIDHRRAEEKDEETKLTEIRRYILSKAILLQKHINGEKKPNGKPYALGGKTLEEFTRYFECSSEYLVGTMEEPTKQETDICQITGLSEMAVKHLAEAQEKAQKDKDITRSETAKCIESLSIISELLERSDLGSKDNIFYLLSRYIAADTVSFVAYPENEMETSINGKAIPKAIKNCTFLSGIRLPDEDIEIVPEDFQYCQLRKIDQALTEIRRDYQSWLRETDAAYTEAIETLEKEES